MNMIWLTLSSRKAKILIKIHSLSYKNIKDKRTFYVLLSTVDIFHNTNIVFDAHNNFGRSFISTVWYAIYNDNCDLENCHYINY